MKRNLRWPTLILAAALVASQAPAWAAPTAAPAPGQDAVTEARARFNRGVALYRQANFDAALVEFRRAYELAPNFRILFNIGQASYELHKYAVAQRAFEQYLAEGGAHLDARRKAEVDAELQKLRVLVGHVAIVVSAPGAEVFVDDVLVGTAPLAGPVTVDIGTRRISASLAGYSQAARVIEVGAAESVRVPLDLAPIAVAAPPASSTPAPETTVVPPLASGPPSSSQPGAAIPAPVRPAGPKHPPLPLWVGWSSAGVLAAGSAVMGVLALGASSDLRNEKDSSRATARSLNDASSRTHAYALATDVLAGAAFVAGGLTLYWTLTTDGTPDQQKPSVQMRLAPNGAALSGTF